VRLALGIGGNHVAGLILESAHRYITQERLKIAGACWNPDNVNPMLALRVVRANPWWDEFWQWRLERQQVPVEV
jgi:hypothetical protein